MYGPGSASFALVAWTMVRRVGRWSFWRRGTGERMLQHHCKGTESHEPADPEAAKYGMAFRCRSCGVRARRSIRMLYWAKKERRVR